MVTNLQVFLDRSEKLKQIFLEVKLKIISVCHEFILKNSSSISVTYPCNFTTIYQNPVNLLLHLQQPICMKLNLISNENVKFVSGITQPSQNCGRMKFESDNYVERSHMHLLPGSNASSLSFGLFEIPSDSNRSTNSGKSDRNRQTGRQCVQKLTQLTFFNSCKYNAFGFICFSAKNCSMEYLGGRQNLHNKLCPTEIA